MVAVPNEVPMGHRDRDGCYGESSAILLFYLLLADLKKIFQMV